MQLQIDLTPDAPSTAILAAALTEWDRRYREEPDRFASELLLHSGTPETYGDRAAPYLVSILAEQAQQ
jgi:hypothetical protein